MKTQKEIVPCICGSLDHKRHPSVTPETQKESKATHTQGPWKVSEVSNKGSVFQALVGNQDEGWIIAGVYRHPKLQFNGKEHVHVNTVDRQARALADASLISAAPELRDTLVDLAYYFQDQLKGTALAERVQRVIAKAEGRE